MRDTREASDRARAFPRIFDRHAGYPSVLGVLRQARLFRGRRSAKRGRIPMRSSPTAESASGCTRSSSPRRPSPSSSRILLAASGRSRKTWAAFRVSPARQRRVQRTRLARPFGSPDSAGRGPHLQSEQARGQRHLLVRLFSSRSRCPRRSATPPRSSGRDSGLSAWKSRMRCCRMSPAPATRSTSDFTIRRTCAAHAALRCR